MVNCQNCLVTSLFFRKTISGIKIVKGTSLVLLLRTVGIILCFV